MILALVERYIELDKALLVGFAVAGVAFVTSRVATLFLNDKVDQDVADTANQLDKATVA